MNAEAELAAFSAVVGLRKLDHTENADPDLIQLGVAHCFELCDEAPDRMYGVLFHRPTSSSDDSKVSMYVNGQLRFNPRSFKYFNTVQPYQHTYLIPQDGTLGCYFMSDSSNLNWTVLY